MTEFRLQDAEDCFYEVLCRAMAGEAVTIGDGDQRVIVLPVRPEDGPMFRAILEAAKAQFGEAFRYEWMLDVATMADVIAQNFSSRPAAYWWIRAAPLEGFEGQTPLQVLMEGRYDVLLEHVRSIVTREGLDDVDAGRLVSHEGVEAWLRNVVVPAYDVYAAQDRKRAIEAPTDHHALTDPSEEEAGAGKLADVDRRVGDQNPTAHSLEEMQAGIQTDEGHRAALREIDSLWGAKEGSEDWKRLDLLIALVAAYEERHWPLHSVMIRQVKTFLKGRYDEHLIDRLSKPLTLKGFEDWRSATAALEACQSLFSGDVDATVKWMNNRIFGTEFTPLQLAEQDDDGLMAVLDHIGRIDAGVYF